MLDPEAQRRFAVEVVHRLRGAGFTAYWAGGCVRDQLLGRTPADYDIATNAVPEQIRTLFGRRRTLAIGAAFGVISVLGPKAAGAVEVATFRRDAAYADGRHPDSVTFSSPEEDAERRDFTVNGLFFDPVDDRVIDFVGGQQDLAAGRLRAIGDPRERFAEDKLRMLRAVRFATTLGFALDDATRRAIVEMAAEIHVVSPERIAAEMQRLLAHANRMAGVQLLLDVGLAAEILPEITPNESSAESRRAAMRLLLSRLASDAQFPLALAATLTAFVDRAGTEAICQRWRLSNKDSERIAWLVENYASLANARAKRWSALHPLLTADGVDDLLKLTEAASEDGVVDAAYCRELLARPRAVFDPPPLLTGGDLLAIGMRAGPMFKTVLDEVRAAQLDGEIPTKNDAIAFVKKRIVQ